MRSYPLVWVTCDRCRRQAQVTLLRRADSQEEEDEQITGKLEMRVWKVIDGYDLCPDCRDSEEDI